MQSHTGRSEPNSNLLHRLSLLFLSVADIRDAQKTRGKPRFHYVQQRSAVKIRAVVIKHEPKDYSTSLQVGALRVNPQVKSSC